MRRLDGASEVGRGVEFRDTPACDRASRVGQRPPYQVPSCSVDPWAPPDSGLLSFLLAPGLSSFGLVSLPYFDCVLSSPRVSPYSSIFPILREGLCLPPHLLDGARPGLLCVPGDRALGLIHDSAGIVPHVSGR